MTHKFVRFAAISCIRLVCFTSLEKLESIKLNNNTKHVVPGEQNHREDKDFEGLMKDFIFLVNLKNKQAANSSFFVFLLMKKSKQRMFVENVKK